MQGDTVLAYRIVTIRVLWIREFDKFIFCVCHTRKTVQASGSPMFFLLLKRPPTPGDHTGGVWAALARACARSSRGDGQTVVIPTSRRAADVVAGPRPRERAVDALQAVVRAVKYRRRGLGAREATGAP